MSDQRELTPNEIRRMTRQSQARSEARRAPWGPRKVAASAAAGAALVATTVILAFGMRGNNAPAPSGESEGSTDNVPEETRAFLGTLPTKTVTISQGEGLDDAIYKVNDPDQINQSADIKAGVTAMLQDEVLAETGGDLPQVGEELDVAVVPPVQNIPPEAR